MEKKLNKNKVDILLDRIYWFIKENSLSIRVATKVQCDDLHEDESVMLDCFTYFGSDFPSSVMSYKAFESREKLRDMPEKARADISIAAINVIDKEIKQLDSDFNEIREFILDDNEPEIITSK